MERSVALPCQLPHGNAQVVAAVVAGDGIFLRARHTKKNYDESLPEVCGMVHPLQPAHLFLYRFTQEQVCIYVLPVFHYADGFRYP